MVVAAAYPTEMAIIIVSSGGSGGAPKSAMETEGALGIWTHEDRETREIVCVKNMIYRFLTIQKFTYA